MKRRVTTFDNRVHYNEFEDGGNFTFTPGTKSKPLSNKNWEKMFT